MVDYQKIYVNPKKGNPNSNYQFYHKKQFHSRRTRLSVFNHYIEFGSVPRKSDIMNSWSSKPSETYKSRKTTTTYTIAATNVRLEREIKYLDKLNEQDLIGLINEFKDTAALCNWTPEAALEVLRNITTPEIYDEIRKAETLKDAFNTLIELRYPRLKADIYLKRLSRYRQDDYYLIRDYMKAIEQDTKKLACCMKWKTDRETGRSFSKLPFRKNMD